MEFPGIPAMALNILEDEWASWSAGDRGAKIDFRIAVMEEICACAIDGLTRFRHGGIEVGGVLYGTFEDGRPRVAAFRPLECEHAFGPRFVLSDKDRAALKELLAAPLHDAALQGLVPVGWYHSHTRSDISLSARDMEIYDGSFPEPNQIALLVRPDEFEPARAGFFFRENGGATVHTLSSYAEFFVQPRRHGLDQPAVAPPPSTPPTEKKRTRRQTTEELAESLFTAEAAPLEPEVPRARRRVFDGPLDVPGFARIRPPSYRWLWLLPVCLLVLAGGAGAAKYYMYSTPAPLSLWVADVGGQLLIEWDRSSRPVREAESGTLDILDGKQPIEMRIDGDRLREGSIDYERKSDSIDVRLRVTGKDGKTAEETIRFLGQPTQACQDSEVAQHALLRAQNELLRSELEAKDQQIDILSKKAPRLRRR